MEEYERYDGLGLATLVHQGEVWPDRAHAKCGSSPRHNGCCALLVAPAGVTMIRQYGGP